LLEVDLDQNEYGGLNLFSEHRAAIGIEKKGRHIRNEMPGLKLQCLDRKGYLEA
jgi:hypothetical protein